MEAFDVLGDPVRRRILEHLAEGERSAGEVVALVGAEFSISQPAVSQHLRVLRTSGFATVRAEGTRRLYALDPAPLGDVEDWAAGLRRFWEQRLDALGTELARGARERRLAADRAASGGGDDTARGARAPSTTDEKHDTDTTWRAG
ncbi:metalloregulator ArsR/SmtB family transcription factor [Cellulosimicrobium sp. Marseille-Q4280]|uniref:ArsR/SmtB family transcription factor n=1 Tax=Cellulosimicrobium sp. Marseille-Q4280 TaxID=2937992 RepID=UPI0020409C2F|nr:metalloregulator ArsR/SmtB family transcription factor [Cellulosimicrobium sp. Marseille-Q4280]